MKDSEKLTPEEIEAYKNYRNSMANSELNSEEIIKNLKTKGLIMKTKNINWVYQIAASLLIAVAAFMVGRSTTGETTLSNNSSFNYMLVLHQDENFNSNNPEEMFAEYSNWMNSIAERGVKIDGQELKEHSVTVNQNGIKESPNSIVSGYFILEADSIEEVIEIAENSPHVKYGGTVEVKEYMIR